MNIYFLFHPFYHFPSSHLDLDNTAPGLVTVDLGVMDISSGIDGIVELCVAMETLHGRVVGG